MFEELLKVYTKRDVRTGAAQTPMSLGVVKEVIHIERGAGILYTPAAQLPASETRV